MNNNPDKSPHILNASANLLGICFILLTSFKVLGKSSQTIIDDIAVTAIFCFMLSCFFSFLSIRSRSNKAEKYERTADVIFLCGLAVLFITTMLFTFDLIA